MKSFKFKLFVMALAFSVFFINNNAFSVNDSIVRNGSFEKIKIGMYPIDTSPHIGYETTKK